jgi:hypothetical protein
MVGDIIAEKNRDIFFSGDNIATFSKMLRYYRESMVNVAEPAKSSILKAIFCFFSLSLQTDFGVRRVKEQEPKI